MNTEKRSTPGRTESMDRQQLPLFFSISLPLLLLLLMPASFTPAGAAVTYTATNSAGGTQGGTIFGDKIGTEYTKEKMGEASGFIWARFEEERESDRKNVKSVSLNVDTGGGVASTSGDAIRVNAGYLAGFRGGDVKREFTGILYHEMTHVWQWSGKGQEGGSGWLIEGIADFIRLKADLGPSHWVKPGEGGNWTSGYDVTARFLDYCETLKPGFVAQVNRKLRDQAYSDEFFVGLLGKQVNQVWGEYKAKYGKQ